MKLNSLEDMLAFGQKIATRLQGGEVLELVGDVGAGKTTFTKGLALGLGVQGTVQSPTFTISREYETSSAIRLVHYDFYRLQEAGIMADELLDQAYALAKKMTSKSPVAIALSRQMMYRNSAQPHPVEAHKVDSQAIYAMGKSPDGHEGVASFLEKRPANFPGKVSRDLPEFYPWWRKREFGG